MLVSDCCCAVKPVGAARGAGPVLSLLQAVPVAANMAARTRTCVSLRTSLEEWWTNGTGAEARSRFPGHADRQGAACAVAQSRDAPLRHVDGGVEQILEVELERGTAVERRAHGEGEQRPRLLVGVGH